MVRKFQQSADEDPKRDWNMTTNRSHHCKDSHAKYMVTDERSGAAAAKKKLHRLWLYPLVPGYKAVAVTV